MVRWCVLVVRWYVGVVRALLRRASECSVDEGVFSLAFACGCAGWIVAGWLSRDSCLSERTEQQSVFLVLETSSNCTTGFRSGK